MNNEESPINPDWQEQTKPKVVIPALSTRGQPWWRSLIISLIVTLVGGAIALAYYRQERKNIDQEIATPTIEVKSETPLPQEGQTIATGPETAAGTSNSTSAATSATPSTQSSANKTPSSGGTSSSSSTATLSAKTINDSAIKFVEKSYGYCKALAPEDWAFTANNEATGADLRSPDLKKHAGWGIAYTYTALHPDEKAFFDAYLPLVYGSAINFTSSPRDAGYGYLMRDFTVTIDGKPYKGAIFYIKFDIPEMAAFIIVSRMGVTEESIWNSEGGIVLSAAASIRCTTQLKSTTSSSDYSSTRGGKAKDSDLDLSDKWQEATMGYENVYDSRTGEHYQAPLNSKWETGPEGSGYYKQVGNDVIKLERGFGW